MKKHKVKELQDIGRNLGEKNVSFDIKADLCNIILKNKKYNYKSEEEIIKLLQELETKTKIEYYEKLKMRLYKNVDEIKNKNYEKPCLEYKSNHSINITINNRI